MLIPRVYVQKNSPSQERLRRAWGDADNILPDSEAAPAQGCSGKEIIAATVAAAILIIGREVKAAMRRKGLARDY